MVVPVEFKTHTASAIIYPISVYKLCSICLRSKENSYRFSDIQCLYHLTSFMLDCMGDTYMNKRIAYFHVTASGVSKVGEWGGGNATHNLGCLQTGPHWAPASRPLLFANGLFL